MYSYFQLEGLFNNTRVTSIDLSNNNINRVAALHIAKLLKEKVTHIEWIE